MIEVTKTKPIKSTTSVEGILVQLSNGEYYGVKWLNDNTRDTKLFENDIEKIKIENKTMSIIVFTPPIALALCIISASIFNLTFPASFYYKDSITF